jgi:hypothetical protein
MKQNFTVTQGALDGVEVFLSVARHRSFRRAAAELAGTTRRAMTKSGRKMSLDMQGPGKEDDVLRRATAMPAREHCCPGTYPLAGSTHRPGRNTKPTLPGITTLASSSPPAEAPGSNGLFALPSYRYLR